MNSLKNFIKKQSKDSSFKEITDRDLEDWGFLEVVKAIFEVIILRRFDK